MDETNHESNKTVKTDKADHNNKPDIITSGNGTGVRVLIDIAISGHRNVTKKS